LTHTKGAKGAKENYFEQQIRQQTTTTKQMPTKKAVKTDNPLPPDLRAELKDYITRGYKYLKLKQGCSAKQAQEAIFSAIKEVYSGKKKLSRTAVENVGADLGCVWGQTLVDEFGWEWCMADLKGDVFVSVVSPNRAFATQPLGFIQEQLQKRPPEDIDSLMAFNMIAAGRYSKGKAKDYHVFA
jgi:hypothetical protein